jgi:uncharacterized protein (TIGR00251 family)
VNVLDVKIHGTAVRFCVRLQPRSSKNEIGGVLNGALRVWVTAPPVEGSANDALVRLLAEKMGVSRRDVTIVAGAASRNKTVEVSGAGAERVLNLVR